MMSSVAKWGNSLALRIPTAFARELDVREGGSVEISVTNGTLVVRPIDETKRYDLEALLSCITEDNLHGEITAGSSVGNEF